ncbi:myb-related transcription factor, partner of profilin-like isoform X2 [Cololabis saira]|uniref:myb-related transcription factor, partner of profilin-like isoform X2 n=1 Tax=Cololabis saira TaxID=129043 RepID=UPI002AD29B09|nr:myb-related transcription factor, partner of profilin-like isoform X2 [Cololabis saira]
MESLDGKQDSRKRKMKFAELELEILVEEANKHIHELQQRNLSISKRNAIWQKICDRINAVGKTKRTADEVKRRWQDMRRRTKEKVAFNNTSATKTGGGPAEEMPLTSIEQQVQLKEEMPLTSIEQQVQLKEEMPQTSIEQQVQLKEEMPLTSIEQQVQLKEEMPLTSIEQQVQLTFCDEQITGIPWYDTLEPTAEQESSPQVEPSPPQSSNQDPTSIPAEPQKRPVYEDIDREFLQEQKKQSTALEDGLSSVAHEVRAVSSMARALRRDTQAIAAHTRQLVSAVSGLTMAVNTLARGIQDGVQAVVRALIPSGPRVEQPETGEEGESIGEVRTGGQESHVGATCNLRKRKKQHTNVKAKRRK